MLFSAYVISCCVYEIPKHWRQFWRKLTKFVCLTFISFYKRPPWFHFRNYFFHRWGKSSDRGWGSNLAATGSSDGSRWAWHRSESDLTEVAVEVMENRRTEGSDPTDSRWTMAWRRFRWSWGARLPVSTPCCPRWSLGWMSWPVPGKDDIRVNDDDLCYQTICDVIIASFWQRKPKLKFHEFACACMVNLKYDSYFFLILSVQTIDI